MTEADFWPQLEFRLCREFAGLPKKDHQCISCDGFMPDEYFLEGPAPRIAGIAWMGRDGQQQWTFTLLLPKPFVNREAIEWSTLLPPENVTCWMSFDEFRRCLKIDPAAARPDLM